MITEFFINLGLSIAAWFLDLFPDWDVPAELLNLDDAVSGFIAPFSGMGVWAPWVLLVILAGAVCLSFVIALGIKVVRWLIGLIPTMGGGT